MNVFRIIYKLLDYYVRFISIYEIHWEAFRRHIFETLERDRWF